MNTYKRTGIFLFCLLCCTHMVVAGKAMYSITPVNSATVNVPVNFLGTVYYTVTNNTSERQTLKLQLRHGVTQYVSTGYCARPFTLGPGESCTLNLRVDGSVFTTSGFIGGPAVCQASSDFFCSRPAPGDQLSVNSVPYSFMLVSNTGSSNGFIRYCGIGASGTLVSCRSTPATTIMPTPKGIAIIPSGYIYSATATHGSILICSPANQPQNLVCQEFDAGGGVFSQPGSVYINNGYLYVPDFNLETIIKCTVNMTTGALTSCVTAVAGLHGPKGNMVVSNGYAYIPNTYNDSVLVCTVDNVNGDLLNCANSTTPSLGNVTALGISEGYLYIANSGNGNIYGCAINPVNGSIATTCTKNTAALPSPSVGTAEGATVTGGYLYVGLSQTGAYIYKCNLGDNGVVSGCASTGDGFFGPNGSIALIN